MFRQPQREHHVVQLCACPCQRAKAASEMPQTTYELTNYFYGRSSPLCVDTSTNDLELYAGDASCALTWILTNGADAGQYNICTSYKDTDYCLDIVNGGGTCPNDCTTPHLAKPGAYTGQQWTLTSEPDNYHKLSNSFTGIGWYLDTYSDSKVAFMSEGDYQGQYWDLGIVGGSGSFSASSSSTVSKTSLSM